MNVTAENLSFVLQQLSRLGEPDLHLGGLISPKGWWASLQLPAPAGCTAKIRSDMTHKTPEAAVQQLVDRLEALRGSAVADQLANPRLAAA